MSYTAPDPEQFDGMEQAYSYLAPLAAAQIVMPTYVFSGPMNPISRIIYMNQCNPGQIMKAGANWLQLAEKYIAAADALADQVGSLDEQDWSGDDRKAFADKADKVIAQLRTIAAFAFNVGFSLFSIATMLAVLVPLMLMYATVFMAYAVFYLAVKALPPPVGITVAANVRVIVFGLSTKALAVLTKIDTAITVAAQGLAGFIGANMGATWIALASKGNLVNPKDTIRSTGFSLLQGLAQMAMRDLMAPHRGQNPGGKLDLLGPKLHDTVAKAHPWMVGFTGVQGVYNIGNNIAGDVDPDAPNAMADAGIDVMGLDFVPNAVGGFEDKARTGDAPPSWGGGSDSESDDAPR